MKGGAGGDGQGEFLGLNFILQTVTKCDPVGGHCIML